MMSRKAVGSACLVAGTSIGAGMIALPMALSKIGMISSFFLMIFIWLTAYASSLVSLELNLYAGQGLTLGKLARKFSGRYAEAVGNFAFKGLCYALLAAYMYGGGSSVMAFVNGFYPGMISSLNGAIVGFGAFTMIVLACPLRSVDYTNRILFLGLLGVIGVVLFALTGTFQANALSHEISLSPDFSIWAVAIPVVFTSFGFQVIFHTITGYCEKNKKALHQAVFWGSLIPAVVYICWTLFVIAAIKLHRPDFYAQMVSTSVELGEMTRVLSQILDVKIFQFLVWGISFLAIVTSAIGVGLGLIDSWKQMDVFKGKSHVLPVLMTILLPVTCAVLIPSAFIKALAFAGMILAVIAIFLPVYLFFKAGLHQKPANTLFYPLLRWRSVHILLVLSGLGVVLLELFNLLF